MGKSQRTKGAAGERELYGLLHDRLGDVVGKRLLGQARDGGFDIPVGGMWAVESKRQNTGFRTAWMEQAMRAVEGTGMVPVVAHRPDRQPWTFHVPLLPSFAVCFFDGIMPAHREIRGRAVYPMSLDQFCMLVREGL